VTSELQVLTTRLSAEESMRCPICPAAHVAHHSSLPLFHFRVPHGHDWAGHQDSCLPKQSQFAWAQMKANQRHPKGLGEKDVEYASAKTKPICTRSFKFQVGSFKWRPRTSNFALYTSHFPGNA